MSAAATLESRLAAFDPIALEIRDDGAQHVGHAGVAAAPGTFP
jgi:stress-induced morphogen